ncbi:unnamed protein product [Prorocentrum cordatum]|uniref:Uncharacterized protein n=1 Tax=Prorocentrum cordatum TaxID=2364126 RepID=A0ABN9Y2F9_9DINO|nr:unnamed protein product [Polarella glacialis]
MAEAAASASCVAVRRLRRDLESLQRSRNPQLAVRPSEDRLLEWHFVLHGLPADTPYHEGCYHGKILFPPEYPHAPPGILMVTPSGRMEIGKRLCLSMTDFHPESWNPAWSVETILVGLLSFFVSDAETGYGAIVAPEARRRELATESWAVNARDAEFVALFPDFVERPASPRREADGGGDAVARTRLPPAGDQHCAGPVGVQPAASGGLGREAAEREAALAVERGRAEPLLQGAGTAGPEADDDRLEEGGEDGPRECWICRDTSTGEPLILPCACRGSMSGVHASCVEQWIRRHRQSAVSDEAPRCSVCHQQYCGVERRPGPAEFVRHMCYDVCRQVVRIAALVALLMLYLLAASSHELLPPVVRAVLVALFAVVAAHKMFVLTVSLPPHRPPPRHACIRKFFVADDRKLAMHIAEASAMVICLAFACAVRTLPFVFFLPVGVASLMPIGRMCALHPSLACVKRAVRLLGAGG